MVTIRGEGGIRTLGTGNPPYAGLANRCLQPLGHLSKPAQQLFDYQRPVEEEEGFEPPETFASAVFKTAALNHSATPPGPPRGGRQRWIGPPCKGSPRTIRSSAGRAQSRGDEEEPSA